MKQSPFINRRAARWKQFNHKAHAVFLSLKKEINIGVLAVSTLIFANVNTISAQNETLKQTKIYELNEIEVTGTRVPLTEAQSAKPVMVFSRNDIQAAAVHSINDLLEYAAGVDVRQRGEFGIQTDISVRGGTFDQITILLNGVAINNPQTGHLTADFPVSINDIERIEIVEGPAARLFGTSAFTGAINIVTRTGKQNQAAINLMSGEYGLFGGDASIHLTKNTFSQQVSGGYQRSDGATKNSDFNLSRAYYQGAYSSAQADVHWQLGYSSRAYGANTFYSASYPSQFEETNRYLLSVQAETKGQLHFTPVVYWNRSYDHFQLIRNTQTGENFHLNDVYGVNLNTYFNSFLGKTAFGTEMRNEGILSTNLGKPLEEGQYVPISSEDEVSYNKKDNRTNVSYYLEHNILLKHWTVSLGVMANMNTALDHTYRLYPGIDIAYRPNSLWKLFVSWNKALRMPTFTDLYYKSPTLQGNIGLKPEETHAIGIGAKYRNVFIDANVHGFYHKGKNMIDWVMYSSDDVYHSANFKLDNMGVETSVVFYFRQLTSSNIFLDRLNIGYTYIYQQRHDDTEIYKSNYALEYLRHKFTARLDHRIWKNLSVEWAFRWQNRMGSYQKYIENKPTNELVPYPSFGLLDLKLSWERGKYHLFAEANNLLNRTYYDLGNIPQPGFWFKAGAGWKINFR
ncbi:MAG: iron complex outermembrane receptor protein [Candidatus Ordinivivax streblomastigis]|uniref:Iron complex outermembrane receptor protein n=1 Tax=Candidatus Ordinivivax streblomastigis TaxID=2540710 RepID=A0A5M8NT16_9BACT|nr:MAG: iron complex outermembrane receptor protein [Candidatus Ordinivivax streblomastigis]